MDTKSNITRWVGAGLLTAAIAISPSVLAQEEEDDQPMAPEELKSYAETMPGVFVKRIADAGGRVSFVFGEDRVFPQCHASTLADTEAGVVVAWFGGTREKDDDVGIWLSRDVDGEWTDPVELAKVEEVPHWNPVLFGPPNDDLYLFFKVGPEIPMWQTYWMTSKDYGASWSDPAELVAGDHGGRGPVKNKPILLSDGSWMAGASTELGSWKAFSDRSTDKGKTWTRSNDWALSMDEIAGIGAIQPTMWESKPGHVHALVRTAGGVIGRADSEDNGKTWSAIYDTGLPNPNSGIDLVKYDNDTLLMVWNPIGKNWGARTPLTLSMSKDNGKTWTGVAHLETEQGEYSYPAIIRTDDGVAISYTWKRERIRVWEVPDAAIGE